MQSLDRISSLGTAYSADQIKTLLVSQQAQERWFFDKLDAGRNYVADLTPFIDYERKIPKIAHDMGNAVKRSLQFAVMGNGPINELDFLSSLLRPRYQIRTPDGGWAEWALGMFTLIPWDQDHYPGWDWHNLSCADFGQLLTDAVFSSVYTAPTGSSFYQHIVAIVSTYGGKTSIPVLLTPTPTERLPASMSWDIGKTRLSAVNDLLAAINYYPAWFDHDGILRSEPIPDFYTKNPSFVFDTTQGFSTVMMPIAERPDISKVYNQVLVIIEDTRRKKIVVTYNNTNPNDPISIPNWGHVKTLTIRDSRLAKDSYALSRALSEAQAASRQFKVQTVQTFPWALSEDHDYYQLIYAPADEGGLHHHNVVEVGWEHECKAGARTSHIWEVMPGA